MNALVGVAKPGKWGSDRIAPEPAQGRSASRTGGGGPGVGPCAVKEHLAPFLPGKLGDNGPVGMVSAGQLRQRPRSCRSAGCTIAMMGPRRACARPPRSRSSTPTTSPSAWRRTSRRVYTGRNGLVAHECHPRRAPAWRRDQRHRRRGRGQAPDRLRLPRPHPELPGGGHADGPNRPRARSLHELDRFVDAMIQIREEITAIEDGRLDREDKPLKNAPAHCHRGDPPAEWTHAYLRASGPPSHRWPA